VSDGDPGSRPPRWLRGLGRVGDHLLVLAAALAVALGIRHFLVEPFRIPSESMVPTLLVGDHLFVDKLSFGARLPGGGGQLPALRAPRRGEVVVFEAAREGSRILPADLHPGLPRERFVKRVVGLPGDLVQVEGERIRVNGTLLASSGEPAHPLQTSSGRLLRCHEEQSGSRSWQVADDPALELEDELEMRVPEGRYFVLGDNRDHSSDSRVWGTVARSELMGPALRLYWSWDWRGSLGELLRPATWWTLLREQTRWERIGEAIR